MVENTRDIAPIVGDGRYHIFISPIGFQRLISGKTLEAPLYLKGQATGKRFSLTYDPNSHSSEIFRSPRHSTFDEMKTMDVRVGTEAIDVLERMSMYSYRYGGGDVDIIIENNLSGLAD